MEKCGFWRRTARRWLDVLGQYH
ncbi:hypothetical protein E3N32_07920 [Salmonella enterica]|nr:hypothetical protein [Salmonella enterica]EBU3701562.1 hypothetical protein [Salmonella enterica]EDR7167597.1 hypothetical protein [Salmonella enterica subsp. houtenae]